MTPKNYLADIIETTLFFSMYNECKDINGLTK